MNDRLMNALRAKYREPKAVLRDLGLDEALLREGTNPMTGKALDAAYVAGLKQLAMDAESGQAMDANMKDLLALIDMMQAQNPEVPAGEADEEDEDGDEFNPDEPDGDDDDMDPNSAIPGLGEKEKAKDEDMENMGGTDNEGGGDKMGKIRECLKMLTDLLGAGEPKMEEKPAIDAENPALEAKKEEEKAPAMKPAMDAALIVKAVEKRVMENAREIRAAEREVRPYVGELAMDAKNAEEVYRTAARAMGIDDAETIHHSALPRLIKLYGKASAEPRKPAHAMDSASSDKYHEMFPGTSRIGRV